MNVILTDRTPDVKGKHQLGCAVQYKLWPHLLGLTFTLVYAKVPIKAPMGELMKSMTT